MSPDLFWQGQIIHYTNNEIHHPVVCAPRSEFMRQFLLYGHVLSTEEAELYADYELKRNPPTLDNFKEQVPGSTEAPLTPSP